jgi:hypothetical protein
MNKPPCPHEILVMLLDFREAAICRQSFKGDKALRSDFDLNHTPAPVNDTHVVAGRSHPDLSGQTAWRTIGRRRLAEGLMNRLAARAKLDLADPATRLDLKILSGRGSRKQK